MSRAYSYQHPRTRGPPSFPGSGPPCWPPVARWPAPTVASSPVSASSGSSPSDPESDFSSASTFGRSLALLAGMDVHTGTVFASTPETTGIKPFMDLAGQVMARPEYKNAPRVFVIVDNGPDHRGQAAITRLARAHPNAIMIHTPVHASWLNQIEIFFSVIQKKVVTPNDFASLDKLSETLLAFVRRYNQTAKPFSWKYTAADLADLLHRISEHDKQDTRQKTTLTTAA